MKESQKVKDKFYKDGHVMLGEHYSSKVKNYMNYMSLINLKLGYIL